MYRFINIFFLIIILILTFFMLINPQETVNASADGFKLWYSIIVPALLPFFIIAELLVSLGFVNFLGVALEPVMRPVFRLPGCSSLVVVMGFTSGFPVGAVLSKRLYDKQMITSSEAERLVSFTNNSSPLFILGAVGVGMFSSQALGYLLAFSQYLSNLLVGILWRFTAKNSPKTVINSDTTLLRAAWHELLKANNENSSGIGKILGDAIKNSLNNIIAIAGFIVFFSVLTRMLSIWGIMDWIALAIMKSFAFLNFPYSVAYGTSMGIFELTIGAQTVITCSQADLITMLLAVSLILAFSGFSVIAQVMSIMAGTPVRLSFYLLSRLIQMIISTVITLAGYHLFIAKKQAVYSFSIPVYKILYSFDAWSFSMYCLILSLGIIAIMIIISLYVSTKNHQS
ncbi:MAG: sporulation integral membrane protein YlbJ [Syntrophomonadaceae bacterium]|nr:sporulation integral membrane protein YlbJ [Syntrophomonadaceae bacterium]MDD4548143.1 sporulation integral membrane protein YlbJ [Syntrophomonadaceae bacterium]